MDEEAFLSLTGVSFSDFLSLDDANLYPAENGLTVSNCSKYYLYSDPLLGTFDSAVREDAKERFDAAADQLEKAGNGSSFAYLFTTLGKLCRLLSLKADLGVRLRRAYLAGDRAELSRMAEVEIPEIIRRLDAFYAAFSLQWEKDNKSYGFEVQTIRIGGLRQRLLDVSRILSEYVSGKREKIEELSEPLLPLGMQIDDPAGAKDPSRLSYNQWMNMATTARLDF